MSLKQKTWIVGIVLAAGLLPAVFGPRWLGLLLLLAGFALDVALCRCPHCGTWLGKYPGEYCSCCGEKLDWDKRTPGESE